MKKFLTVRHFADQNALKTYGHNGPLKMGQEKILHATAHKVLAEAKSSGITAVRILVLAPHPDDESIGCGGFILKYSGQCDVVVLTDGRHGGLSGQSETEIHSNYGYSYPAMKDFFDGWLEFSVQEF